MNSDPRKLPQILYIAESEESRSLVRRLLAHDFVVLEAANPLDGLELAEETRPNLILLDTNILHMTTKTFIKHTNSTIGLTNNIIYV